MRIIDTHTHIYDEIFDTDIDDVIRRAKENGVDKILLPNVDIGTLDRLHSLVSSYPDYCLPMMGLHPTSIDEDWEKSLSIIRSQLEKESDKYIAIGEIGIDLYWDKTFKEEQQKAFEQQLEWSIEFNLPVSIHTREATSEAIDCVRRVGKDHLRGVFHSFVGTRDELQSILELGNFIIGINGVVTYKNSNLREVLLDTDLSKIVVETDAPYLTPVPFRGKRNESSYTIYIVEELAKIYNTTPDRVKEETTKNAKTMFALL